MRVIRNLTVHDGIAGICWLVLEMYSDIKELFVAGGSKVTTDDIKGFPQFPPNLGREEIIIKEYFLKFYHRHIPHWGRVLLSLCLKFTMPTSDWALCHQHRVHFHLTLHNKGPSQSKVNSLLHLRLSGNQWKSLFWPSLISTGIAARWILEFGGTIHFVLIHWVFHCKSVNTTSHFPDIAV